VKRTHCLSFAAPTAVAATAWAETGEPGHIGGLGTAVLTACALWPLTVIAAVFLAPAIIKAAVPRRWRIHYRRTHPRPAIPAHIRRAVHAADRHRCVYCKNPNQPQIDHIRPWAAGGLNTLTNYAILCQPCNLIKSNYWPTHPTLYRPWTGHNNPTQAAAILAAERRHRYNPLRWYRAATTLR